jgi:UPF0042 nucleotide-binding protein
MKIVIITGMSGAGRTKAADWFEDQGYYCVDNMPPQLIKNFLDLALSSGRTDKIAFVTDLRGGEFFEDIEDVIDNLKKLPDVESTVLFIEASTSCLVRRYNETRRNHPLTGGKATPDVIDKERSMLRSVRDKADLIIDTTNMKVSDFNLAMDKMMFGESRASVFSLNLTSFGFKYGLPAESDVMVDMRFIPNPYYVKSLKHLTGNNKKVQKYVFSHEIANTFARHFHSMILELVPGYIKEGKYHLNIAFGCTGGHHRSVAMTNRMAELFEADGFRVTVTHRDLNLIAKGDSKK